MKLYVILSMENLSGLFSLGRGVWLRDRIKMLSPAARRNLAQLNFQNPQLTPPFPPPRRSLYAKTSAEISRASGKNAKHESRHHRESMDREFLGTRVLLLSEKTKMNGIDRARSRQSPGRFSPNALRLNSRKIADDIRCAAIAAVFTRYDLAECARVDGAWTGKRRCSYARKVARYFTREDRGEGGRESRGRKRAKFRSAEGVDSYVKRIDGSGVHPLSGLCPHLSPHAPSPHRSVTVFFTTIHLLRSRSKIPLRIYDFAAWYFHASLDFRPYLVSDGKRRGGNAVRSRSPEDIGTPARLPRPPGSDRE